MTKKDLFEFPAFDTCWSTFALLRDFLKNNLDFWLLFS